MLENEGLRIAITYVRLICYSHPSNLFKQALINYNMTATPRYTQHFFFGKEFEETMRTFRKLIKWDSRFQKMKKFDEQGVFSIAMRELIKDYIKNNGARVMEEEKQRRAQQNIPPQ